MKGFLLFVLKHHFTLIFIFLQSVSLFLIINYNHTQRETFINSSNYISGIANSKVNGVFSYFTLVEENQRLIKENSNLRNQFLKNYKLINLPSKEVLDSTYLQNYKYLSGEVIQSSVSKTRNFLTLNIGRIQGVEPGSGVVSADGVVGVVKTVSNNYSVVLPVINPDFKVSCRINRNQYFGSLFWDGSSYKKAILQDIPMHVDVQKGDSLYTTGFSSIFPTGELVGIIEKVEKKPGENFYFIRVDLSVDFKRIRSVYVIDHLLKNELDSLKSTVDG